MKKIKIILFITTLSLLMGACGEDYLLEKPKDVIAADLLYKDVNGFNAGLSGLYSYVLCERKTMGSGNVNTFSTATIQGTDIAWAFQWLGPWNNGFNELYRMTPEVGILYQIWNWLYTTINAANTIIERAENPDVNWGGGTDAENEAIKNDVIAQARLIRAWSYRHLTNMWNNIPLKTDESNGNNITYDWMPTPRAEVEAQMEEDWKFAEQHLPDVQSAPGKVSKAVAQHYLAELYLIQKKYADAETYAKKVTESGNFPLATERYGVEASKPGTPYTDIFIDGNVNRNEGNTGVLWSFQREYQVIGGENHSNMRRWMVYPYFYKWKGINLEVTIERGGRPMAGVTLTSYAVTNFGPIGADDRGSKFALAKYYILTERDKISNPDYAPGDTLWMDWSPENMVKKSRGHVSLKKFDWAIPEDVKIAKSYKDAPYLRVAETYLLLAEAYIGQKKLNDAANAINVVRRRAHAAEITAADVDIDFLLDERARELAFEVNRKYALVRNNKYVERVKKYNNLAAPYVAEQYSYLPIPQKVIDASPEYPQNPGYNQ
jgi:hypothetical protein